VHVRVRLVRTFRAGVQVGINDVRDTLLLLPDDQGGRRERVARCVPCARCVPVACVHRRTPMPLRVAQRTDVCAEIAVRIFFDGTLGEAYFMGGR
jgi:hypothetical protein